MRKTIESKTASTILQKKRELIIGQRTYQVAPPTVRTLIDASALIAQLPQTSMDPDNAMVDSLNIAKDCAVLGDILAILILGSRKEQFFIDRVFNTAKRTSDRLARKLLDSLSPAELNNAIAEVLEGMEIADFFALTTFLIDINLLKATREVVTTASGR